MVKDIALTAKQKLGHTSYVHGVLTAESSLFTAVEEVRVSKNLQGLYWRNANRQWADKKVVFSHLSFLIVSKGLEMPAIIEIYTEMMDLKHFKYSKGTSNFAKA